MKLETLPNLMKQTNIVGVKLASYRTASLKSFEDFQCIFVMVRQDARTQKFDESKLIECAIILVLSATREFYRSQFL